MEMIEGEGDRPQTWSVHLPPMPLGTVVAVRQCVLYDSNGQAKQLIVRLGFPVKIDVDFGLPGYRCPAQILGLGIDDIVYAPLGVDGFEAIYNALDVIGPTTGLQVPATESGK